MEARKEERTIFGWELMLDLHGCNEEAISTAETIQRYAKELCKVIDMIPYGEAQTPYFGEKCEHTKGYSLLQFVETSSITGHFSEGTGNAYINIFSCKEFDPEEAKKFSSEFFGATDTISNFVVRP